MKTYVIVQDNTVIVRKLGATDSTRVEKDDVNAMLDAGEITLDLLRDAGHPDYWIEDANDEHPNGHVSYTIDVSHGITEDTLLETKSPANALHYLSGYDGDVEVVTADRYYNTNGIYDSLNTRTTAGERIRDADVRRKEIAAATE